MLYCFFAGSWEGEEGEAFRFGAIRAVTVYLLVELDTVRGEEGVVHALREGEADEAVGGLPATSSEVIVSLGFACAIAGGINRSSAEGGLFVVNLASCCVLRVSSVVLFKVCFVLAGKTAERFS